MFRARMQREAGAAGRLTEPHVVPIHDYGEINGQLYLDMRLIERRAMPPFGHFNLIRFGKVGAERRLERSEAVRAAG